MRERLQRDTHAPLSDRCGRPQRPSAGSRSGRAPSVSTEDRLTLASVSNCGSADVVIRHDRWSSAATVSSRWTETLAAAQRLVCAADGDRAIACHFPGGAGAAERAEPSSLLAVIPSTRGRVRCSSAAQHALALAAVRQPPALALGAGRDHHDPRLAPRPRVQGEPILKLADLREQRHRAGHHPLGIDPRAQPDQPDDGRRVVARPEHRHRRRPQLPPRRPLRSRQPIRRRRWGARRVRNRVAGAATALIARGRQQPVRHRADFRTADTQSPRPGGFRVPLGEGVPRVSSQGVEAATPSDVAWLCQRVGFGTHPFCHTVLPVASEAYMRSSGGGG